MCLLRRPSRLGGTCFGRFTLGLQHSCRLGNVSPSVPVRVFASARNADLESHERLVEGLGTVPAGQSHASSFVSARALSGPPCATFGTGTTTRGGTVPTGQSLCDQLPLAEVSGQFLPRGQFTNPWSGQFLPRGQFTNRGEQLHVLHESFSGQHFVGQA